MRHPLRNASLGTTLTGVYVIVWLLMLQCVARLFRLSGLNRRAASFPARQLRSKLGRHDVIGFKTAQQTEISCAHTSLCLLFLRLDISWSFSWYDAAMGDFTQCRIVRASGYGQLLQFDNGLFSTFLKVIAHTCDVSLTWFLPSMTVLSKKFYVSEWDCSQKIPSVVELKPRFF